MAKPELGTKRVCPETGRKFYDLNKTPVISPYTGQIVPIIPLPTRASRAEPARHTEPTAAVEPETADAEFVSLEDADAELQGSKSGVKVDVDDDTDDDDPALDDTFIEEQEDGDPDVTDIIGDAGEKDEES